MKLMLSPGRQWGNAANDAYHLGKRVEAMAFRNDFSGRLANGGSPNALRTYIDLVEEALGADFDLGRRLKFFKLNRSVRSLNPAEDRSAEQGGCCR